VQHSIIEQSISERLSKDSRRSQSVIGNEILVRTLNMDEWAATRMESLLWEEKLDRIKALYRDGYTHSVVRHSLRY
jgi:hypothetical protein